MTVNPDSSVNDMELFRPEIIHDGEHRVVVQAREQLKFYRWIRIDGQNGLGGATYYGGFNLIIDGFAKDPTTGELQTHLLDTPEGIILSLRDLSEALLAGEIEINFLPNSDVENLVTGSSLREVRLREEWKAKSDEEKLAILRSQKHCGTCTLNDCYCSRR